MFALEWVLGPQNLSHGAIDVVALKMSDGSIRCSPFHVKLGNVSKRGENKAVKLKLNGTDIKLQMKLGRAGEAFFVEKAQAISKKKITNKFPSQENERIEEEHEFNSTEIKLEIVSKTDEDLTAERYPMVKLVRPRSFSLDDILQNPLAEKQNDPTKRTEAYSGHHMLSHESRDHSEVSRADHNLQNNDDEDIVSDAQTTRKLEINPLLHSSHTHRDDGMIQGDELRLLHGSVDEEGSSPATDVVMGAEEDPSEDHVTDPNSLSFIRKSRSLADVNKLQSISEDEENPNTYRTMITSAPARPSPQDHEDEGEVDIEEGTGPITRQSTGESESAAPFPSNEADPPIDTAASSIPTAPSPAGSGATSASATSTTDVSGFSSWTWTWGRLPVKSKAKSFADLESLSLPRKRQSALPAGALPASHSADSLKLAEAKGPVTSKLPPVPEYRPEFDEASGDMTGMMSPLSQEEDPHGDIEKKGSDPAVITIDDGVEAGVALASKLPRRLLSLCGDILSGYSSTSSSSANPSDAIEIRNNTDLETAEPINVTTLTNLTEQPSEARSGSTTESDSSLVLRNIPHSTQELIDVLLEHSVPREDLYKPVPSRSLSTNRLSLSSLTGPMIPLCKDPRLVVLLDDFLLPWDVASFILTGEAIFNVPWSNVYIPWSVEQEDTNTSFTYTSRRITADEIENCLKLFGLTSTTKDKMNYWCGKRVSTWSRDGGLEAYRETAARESVLLVDSVGAPLSRIDEVDEEEGDVEGEGDDDSQGKTESDHLSIPDIDTEPLEDLRGKSAVDGRVQDAGDDGKVEIIGLAPKEDSYGNLHDIEELSDGDSPLQRVKQSSPFPPNNNNNNSNSQNNNNSSTFESEAEQDPEESVQDISLDDISPQFARMELYDDSDNDSYFSLNLEEENANQQQQQQQSGMAPQTMSPQQAAAWAAEYKQVFGENMEPRKKYKYHKTLVPTQEQLQSMGLKDGVNDVIFESTGCPPVKAQIFVWAEDAKVVVVDVDALLTTVGGWTAFMGAKRYIMREGADQFLNTIAKNGYQLLLLSSDGTFSKDVLSKAKTGKASSIPAAPLFTSPDALMKGALPGGGSGSGSGRSTNAVIQRPDIFKASALRGLRSLFPPMHNPYYAGFCARSMDMIAFSRCEIPKGRIFTINNKGDIQSFNLTFRKSYFEMNQEVDTLFPAVADAFYRRKENVIPSIKVTNNVASSSRSSQNEASSSSSTSILSPRTAMSTSTVEDTFGDYNFWKIPPKLLDPK